MESICPNFTDHYAIHDFSRNWVVELQLLPCGSVRSLKLEYVRGFTILARPISLKQDPDIRDLTLKLSMASSEPQVPNL